MKPVYSKGFTLIELLTVIAIISILAGLTFTVGPRMLERARMNRVLSAMRQVDMALEAYRIDHQTYPPAYGYVSFAYADDMEPPDDPAFHSRYYNLLPFMTRMQYHGHEDFHDDFSTSYDTVNDGRLSMLEFSPIGQRQADGSYNINSLLNLPRYTGEAAGPLGQEVNQQLTTSPRPFVYIPVNMQQFSRAQRYWLEAGDAYAESWDPSHPLLERISFPPRTYDAFVLISVGPAGNTFGLLPEPRANIEMLNNGRDAYHILGMRAYFLATRDLNANGLLDFDYRARTQQGEAAQVYNVTFPNSGFDGPVNNQLPPATQMRDGAGPVIWQSQQ